MTSFQNRTKPFVLFFAILIGLILNGSKANAATETAIVAGGCFWCVEADFESVPGVIKVVPGFTGGRTKNPTYAKVGKGGTGHLEAVKITFNSSKISYDEILHLFLRSVDVTDAGGQFCDRGESYTTAIFYKNAAQKAAAKKAIAQARADLGRRIVTPIRRAMRFYSAGPDHQNYYRGKRLVLTRFGIRQQATAYKKYRAACGRDKKVRRLWGAAAPFVSH